MQGFLNFINQFGPITDVAGSELTAVMQKREFKKGEMLANDHRTCHDLYFLESGLVKLYFVNHNGKEIILRFFNENSVFTSLQSYLTRQPSVHFIKALEETTVFAVEKSNFELLCSKHNGLSVFYQKFLEQININMLQRVTELLRDDAKMRYNQFTENNPVIARRISLGDMADYLGITQVSLSRIRAGK